MSQELNYRDKGFRLGFCACGCNTEIPITTREGRNKLYIKRYKLGHNSKGMNNPAWKGGKGYEGRYNWIYNYLHPNRDSNNRVYEHVYVMSCWLGRPLEKGEEIHHYDEDKHNNKINNLWLTTHKDHAIFHTKQRHQMERIKKCLIQ